MRSVLILAAILASSPAMACRWGGPCNDGSPYDYWVQGNQQQQPQRTYQYSFPTSQPSYSVPSSNYQLPNYNTNFGGIKNSPF